MADYSITFRILTANSGWNEPALLACFRNGLNPESQLDLTCRDKGLDLNDCIVLVIKLDQHLRGQGQRGPITDGARRRSLQRVTPTSLERGARSEELEGELMEVNSSRLPEAEHQWRRSVGLCLD